MAKFIADNPDIPEEERAARFYGLPKTLSFEESLKHYEDGIKLAQINNYLYLISYEPGCLTTTGFIRRRKEYKAAQKRKLNSKIPINY